MLNLSSSFFCYIVKIFYGMFFLLMKLFARPSENAVAFVSVPDYSDNARVLSEFIESKGNFRIYWCVENVEKWKKILDNKRIILLSSKLNKYGRHSFSTLYNLYKCKYLFYTHFSIMNKKRKKKGQLIINLWHGCGYKDSESSNSKNVVFDYALVPGEAFINVKSKFWGASPDIIIPIGYPRYDLFLRDVKNKSFLNAYKVDPQTKIVIWMPTFRKSLKNDYPEGKIQYRYDFPLMSDVTDLQSLDDFCDKNNITLIIKRHPFQKKYSFEGFHFKRINVISNEELECAGVQLYEILPSTDALISDYSSIAIDYILLNKPMAFSLDDFDEYEKTRGFVFENPLEYMPGHHLYVFDDLIGFLRNVADQDDVYKDARSKLLPLMHNPCNNYCQRICDFFRL